MKDFLVLNSVFKIDIIKNAGNGKTSGKINMSKTNQSTIYYIVLYEKTQIYSNFIHSNFDNQNAHLDFLLMK